MKYIKNNSDNVISFVHENVSLSDGTHIVFTQLGSENYKNLHVSFVEEDCFVSIFSFTLSNYTPNGLYTIVLVDAGGNSLVSSTAVVDGMDYDEKRSYIVEDIAEVVDENLILAMKLNGKL